MDKVRVRRIIEYTGPRDQVERQIAISIHGEKHIGDMTIHATTISGVEIVSNITSPMPLALTLTPARELNATDKLLMKIRAQRLLDSFNTNCPSIHTVSKAQWIIAKGEPHTTVKLSQFRRLPRQKPDWAR